MKGIDIASYQQNVDFVKVKNSGIEIVYIKATEGITYNNPLFRITISWSNCSRTQNWVLSFLKSKRSNIRSKTLSKFNRSDYQTHCKYVIDVEEILGQTVTKISSNVRLFADYIISNKKEVCIYTGDYFYKNNLNNSVKDISLWVAHYGVTKPDAINYIGFQYSNKGNVDGINGFVDLNEFSSGIFINSVSPVNIVLKTFQHAVNLVVGLTDKNGNKLVETWHQRNSYQRSYS